MSVAAKNCPSSVQLERAYWEEDSELADHLSACGSCAGAIDEIRALRTLGERIAPAALSAAQQEQQRTNLLARVAGTSRPASQAARGWLASWRAPAALGLAAAAALVLVWWARTGAVAPVERGHIVAGPGAVFTHESAQPDEVVRLVDGTITVRVDPLHSGERFRVITSAGDVEVRGTAFVVTADGQGLRAVEVTHGVVEVRTAHGQQLTLTRGQSWSSAKRAALDEPAAPLAPRSVPTPESGATVLDVPSVPRTDRPGPRPHSVQGSAPRPAQVSAGKSQAFGDGFAAMRSGRFAEAATAFARAQKESRGTKAHEDAAYWRAVALARAGRKSAAGDAFREFLRAHPSSARVGEVSVMLGWIRLDEGLTVESEKLFRRGLSDRSPRVRDSAESGLQTLNPDR